VALKIEDYALIGDCETAALASAQEPPPRRINAEKAFKQTEEFWKSRCGTNSYEGAWKDAIERSLITLKALTHRPSGASLWEISRRPFPISL
jgi:GH15 family glucan-1,4-alpha-glucosidase